MPTGAFLASSSATPSPQLPWLPTFQPSLKHVMYFTLPCLYSCFSSAWNGLASVKISFKIWRFSLTDTFPKKFLSTPSRFSILPSVAPRCDLPPFQHLSPFIFWYWTRSQVPLVQTPTLPIKSCMDWGTSLSLRLGFHICKNEILKIYFTELGNEKIYVKILCKPLRI